MASASLAPYKSNSATETFTSVGPIEGGYLFKVSGRGLATPYLIEVKRKFTSGSSASNDHTVLRIARTERNTTTGKLATAQVLVDISIPKDTSILTAAVLKEMLAVLSSLLNECTAMEATNAKITALVEGYDL